MTIYTKQTDIFDPINQRIKLKILGVGSIGSFLTITLSKLGFNDIEIYDFDKVEEHNIPNQFYRLCDINKFKVDALREIVKDFTNIEIKTNNIKIDKDTNLNIDLDTVVILAFDSLESRKIVYNQIKEYPIIMIDARMGGEEYNIQVVNLENDEDKESYEESLNIIPTKLPCGAQSIIYSISSIASEVSNIVKKINNQEDYIKVLKRHMKTYLILKNG